MNGKELYELYAAEFGLLSIGIDDWDDLSFQDHIVWNKMAALLQWKPETVR